MHEDLRDTGWEHLPSEGLIGHLGGLWQRIAEERLEIGFIAQDFHLNPRGVVHGGMLMTVMDRAFGMASRFYSESDPMATISLTHQFMTPLRPGAFAMVQPRLMRSTPRMAFLEGTMMSEGEPIVQAQGVWRMTRRD